MDTAPDINDSKLFLDVLASFEKLNISKDEQMTMISVISSVLLLGNIEFEDSGDDNKECRLMEESSNILSKIARNLKIEDGDLRKALLTKKLANMNIV